MNTYIDREPTECVRQISSTPAKNENVRDLVGLTMHNLTETLCLMGNVKAMCIGGDAPLPVKKDSCCIYDDMKNIHELSLEVLNQFQGMATWLGCV